jgi:hypothetical protein
VYPELGQTYQAFAGKTVKFIFGNYAAKETAIWQNSEIELLNLSSDGLSAGISSGTANLTHEPYVFMGTTYIDTVPAKMVFPKVQGTVSFQAQPSRPHVFAGTVTVGGLPAADGTVVTALIKGVPVASSVVGNRLPVTQGLLDSLASLGTALVKVFLFDPKAQLGERWRFYDPRPDFAEFNTIRKMEEGHSIGSRYGRHSP